MQHHPIPLQQPFGYYRLMPCQNKAKSLSECIPNWKQMFIVGYECHNPETGNSYYRYEAFPTYKEFFAYICNIRLKFMHFYENIPERPQKMKYDIDIKRSECPPELFNTNYSFTLISKVILKTY